MKRACSTDRTLALLCCFPCREMRLHNCPRSFIRSCPPHLHFLTSVKAQRLRSPTAKALQKDEFCRATRRRHCSILSCFGDLSAEVARSTAKSDPRKPTAPGKQATVASAAPRDNPAGPSNDPPVQSSGQQAEQLSSLTGLKPFHVAAFAAILAFGLAFLAVLLYITADMQFQRACIKVVKRLLKTVALRQVMGILAAMTFVRFGLEPLVKVLRRVFSAQGTWEKSSEYYILREVWSRQLPLDSKT